MPVVKLKYGKEVIEVNIPDSKACFINFREPEKKIDPDLFYSRLGEHFSPSEIHNKKTLVVISDKTRLCGYDIYLPVLDQFITGQRAGPISYIIAYGTHQRQSDAESIAAYGDFYNQADFIHPSTEDHEKYINLGKTKRGTLVEVRKEIVNSDLLITFGAISHHYFAGYGGGRKLLFPGLAAKEPVYQNHSLFLDKTNKCLHDRCKAGILDGNPIAEDLKEIDRLMPAKTSIYGILNSKGELCQTEIGNNYDDFVRVCTGYDKNFRVDPGQEFDLVIASCGGFPKDINFIQSHKAVHNAASFVKDGGNLIIFSECIDGIGSETFLPYFEMGYQKAFENLSGQYKGNGGTALSMMEKTKRIHIFLVTELDEKALDLTGSRKITTEQASELIRSHNGEIAIIENAGYVIRK